MNNSSAVAERPASNVVHLDDHRQQRAEMIRVLQSSLYTGAKPESVELVLGYCSAAGLDPMQKPVHIVPMSVKVGRDDNGDDKYEQRDTIMPGVGLYRTQAARTGQYAGMDEPQFGPIRTMTYRKKFTDWVDGPNGRRQKKDRWDDVSISYPEWCRVTVYRLVAGVRCAFPAVEFWIENYATVSRWSDAPNSMWERRTHGQLAKCAEAQALRKAFPEAVGAAPTAEEMEGRYLDGEVLPPSEGAKQSGNPPFEPAKNEPEKKKEPEKPALPVYPQDKWDENFESWKAMVASGEKTPDAVIRTLASKYTVSEAQKTKINNLKKTGDQS